MSQLRSEETRNQILDSAQKLFSQNGYDASGVAEICQSAGVSKGAFYHHFPSKQALFMALLERWLNGITAGLEAIRQGASDVPQTILRMTDLLPAIFQDAGGRLPLFLEYWLQASRDARVWEMTIAPYRRYQEYFASLVRDGMAEGSLREMDPDIASRVIVALALGMLLQGLLDPQGADWGQVARHGLEMFMLGSEHSSDGKSV